MLVLSGSPGALREQLSRTYQSVGVHQEQSWKLPKIDAGLVVGARDHGKIDLARTGMIVGIEFDVRVKQERSRNEEIAVEKVIY